VQEPRVAGLGYVHYRIVDATVVGGAVGSSTMSLGGGNRWRFVT